MKRDFGCYVFNNFYLQGIQAGIQSAHSVTELFVNTTNKEAHDKLMHWATNDKVMFVLNGGMQSDLEAVWQFLSEHNDELQLPIAKFHEEEAALNGALTSVAVVVPYHIMAAADTWHRYANNTLSDYSMNSVTVTAGDDGVTVNITVAENDSNGGVEILINRIYSDAELELMTLLRSKKLM